MELTFGEQIKIILKRKNMTIRQLAELVEVQTGKPMSRQNLTQKLNRDNFQEQDMKEVAQALGCTVQISVIDSAKAVVPAAQNVSRQSLPEEAASAEGDGIAEKPEKARLQKSGGRKTGKASVGRLRAVHHEAALQKPQLPKQEESAQETPARGTRGLAELEAAITEQPIPADHEISAGQETAAEGTDVNADVLKEIEMALLESVRKELEQSGVQETEGQEAESQETGNPGETASEEPEADSLAWARQKPSVWPTLTVPRGSWTSTMPFGENELLIDVGSTADAEAPLDAGLLIEPLEETELMPGREREPEGLADVEGPPETEIAPGEEGKPEPEKEPEEEGKAEPEKEPEEEGEAEPEEEPDVEEEREAKAVPDVEGQPETEGLSDVEINPGSEENASEEQGSLDDLEFFDLADFGGGEISQVSAPYIMKRERSSEKKMLLGKKNAQEKKALPEKKNLQEKKLLSGRKGLKDKKEQETSENIRETQDKTEEIRGFERFSEGNGADVSFASAPYVISREPEEKTGKKQEEERQEEEIKGRQKEEVFQEELPAEDMEGFKAFDILSGSRKGDISSVSAPYVIPREPEKETIQETGGEQAGEFAGEWGNEPDEEAPMEEEWPEWPLEEEEEEDPPEPALEEKIASWDAAVKKRLENPFLMSLEERKARRMAKEAEEKQEAGSRAEKDTEVKEPGTGNRPEEKGQEKPEGQPVQEIPEDNRTDLEEPDDKKPEEEEEPVKKQGPDINPLTGKEYETNTVKHHPKKPDMLLVYDQDEHRWIEQAERAFLNFQINKRALLGKDYEPPVYLD